MGGGINVDHYINFMSFSEFPTCSTYYGCPFLHIPYAWRSSAIFNRWSSVSCGEGRCFGVPLIALIMDSLNNSMLPFDSSISTTCTSLLHPLSCPCSESVPHTVTASGALSCLSNPGNFCTNVLRLIPSLL
jgi:hypothetical protein